MTTNISFTLKVKPQYLEQTFYKLLPGNCRPHTLHLCFQRLQQVLQTPNSPSLPHLPAESLPPLVCCYCSASTPPTCCSAGQLSLHTLPAALASVKTIRHTKHSNYLLALLFFSLTYLVVCVLQDSLLLFSVGAAAWNTCLMSSSYITSLFIISSCLCCLHIFGFSSNSKLLTWNIKACEI